MDVAGYEKLLKNYWKTILMDKTISDKSDEILPQVTKILSEENVIRHCFVQ